MLSWVPSMLLSLSMLLARAADLRSADVQGYELGAGDEITVVVSGQDKMTGTFQIRSDCTIKIPDTVQAVPVCELTVEGATTAITASLAATVLVNPQVNLSVKTYSRVVEVLGGVVTPGEYPLKRKRTTFRTLLASVGGLADQSAPTVRITRTSGEVVEVDLERLRLGDPSADVELFAGDSVYVPPVQSVYMDGQVVKPGPVTFRDGLTLTQAITQAGSTTTIAREGGAYILRGEEKIPVNLKRILRGDDADVALLPNDHVYVPESVF